MRTRWIPVVGLLMPLFTMAQGGPSSLSVAPCLPVFPSLLRTDVPFRQAHLLIPTPWSYQRLGVFCKLDVQLERRWRIPLRFRLADVQHAEVLEGSTAPRQVW